MPRYTLCPYYIDENNTSISCEDVCRSFDSMDRKWKWMDMYSVRGSDMASIVVTVIGLTAFTVLVLWLNSKM